MSAEPGGATNDNIVMKSGQALHTIRASCCSAPKLQVIRTRGGGAIRQEGPAAPRGKVCPGGNRCSIFKDRWEGILSPASGAAAAEPSLLRTVQREGGRNVGTVPGAAASLQCWRKVLSSQPRSFVVSPSGWNWSSQAGPKPLLSAQPPPALQA